MEESSKKFKQEKNELQGTIENKVVKIKELNIELQRIKNDKSCLDKTLEEKEDEKKKQDKEL